MAAEGLRPNAIAVKLGVSIWTIHADAKAAHVRLFGTPARALSTDEIRRRIAAGETVGAIAASSQITRPRHLQAPGAGGIGMKRRAVIRP